MKWAYGVTTVGDRPAGMLPAAPPRRTTTLPRTLASLKAAGFPAPRLFVDGDDDGRSWSREFDLPVTCRGGGRIRTAGNWVSSAVELYLRDPAADLFAVFQDDCIASRNLRPYLEASVRRRALPRMAYANLYTFASNQSLSKGVGWFRSNQLGRGAVGLVFDRDAMLALLSDSHLFARAQCPHRGWKKIDGGIVEAMTHRGFAEFCHDPSPLQHTGDVSESENMKHAPAPSFRGEAFDMMTLSPAMQGAAS